MFPAAGAGVGMPGPVAAQCFRARFERCTRSSSEPSTGSEDVHAGCGSVAVPVKFTTAKPAEERRRRCVPADHIVKRLIDTRKDERVPRIPRGEYQPVHQPPRPSATSVSIPS